MRKMLVFVMMLTLVGSAMAADLGNKAPAKPDVTYPQNVPSDMRQGGDTILTATAVVLPVVDMAGTTSGYTDDYDEVCPYSNSTAPDVVYTFTATEDADIDVDLCGSGYDTKLYMYDENLNLVACNDDFYFDATCGTYVSKLEAVSVMSGMTYYVIVDGYGGAFGDYLLNIDVFEPCVLECPAGAELEGEPPLVDGYEDAYNGGCNSPQFGNPFGAITSDVFCGVSGWYLSAGGSQYRDTDWYEITVPSDGFVEILADAEAETITFELGPQDCATTGVVQQVNVGPCVEGNMVIPGAAGSTVWFWVGPAVFDGDGEYNYVLHTNLITATENHSWTDVKALF